MRHSPGIDPWSTIQVFLIYINDLPNCKLVAKTSRLYADDSNLTFSARNINEVQTMINENHKEVHTWLQAKELTLPPCTRLFIITHHNIYKAVLPRLLMSNYHVF